MLWRNVHASPAIFVALSLRGATDDIALSGHDVLSPILIRDGHLPSRMFAAAGRATPSPRRSAALPRARHLADGASIRDYWEQEQSERVAVLGRQLLLKEAETARMGRTHHMLRAAVLDPKRVATIVRRSGRFADRSAAHVRRSAAAR